MTQPSDEQYEKLARLVGATEDEELDCDRVLDRVGAYLKARSERAEMTDYLQQVAQHMKVCPECREEFIALIKAEGLDPAQILDK